jgi:hypothetical protein
LGLLRIGCGRVFLHYADGVVGKVEIESEWTAARRDRAAAETHVRGSGRGSPNLYMEARQGPLFRVQEIIIEEIVRRLFATFRGLCIFYSVFKLSALVFELLLMC